MTVTEFSHRFGLYLYPGSVFIDPNRSEVGGRRGHTVRLDAENGGFIYYGSGGVWDGVGKEMKHSARAPAYRADKKEAAFHVISELIL